VRSDGIVVNAPALDQDDCFPERIEDFPVEQLVPELTVEALIIAVFPWRSWLDVERLDADPPEPVAHGMGSELSAIIATDVIGRSVTLEQLGKDSEDIIALEFALDMDRQTLAAVLVDHCEHAERFPVMGAVHNEVVAPHMAAILWPEPHARSIVEPQPPALGLPLWNLEPSRRQIRSTRLAFTTQPSFRSSAVIRR